jgi:glycosyl transferase family 2
MRRLRGRAKHALDWRFAGVLSRLEAIATRLDGLDARLDGLEARLGRLDALDARVGALAERVESELSPALRAVVTEEAENRRRLHAARDAPGYAAAFEDAEPLVSVVIPTFDRTEALLERAIPSALGQSHGRIEVVVVADGPGHDVRDAVESLGDPRVRFAATTHRVVQADPRRHWLVASALPRNLGTRLARGAWIADLDDDDALRPDAIERLLAHARSERAEVVYGQLETHSPDGAVRLIGAFPLEHGQFGWQGSIAHAGLRFFERELFAIAYGLPGDFFRADRMARTGVRFAHLAEVTCDYYPGQEWDVANGHERRPVM